jgi:hypothetical protein
VWLAWERGDVFTGFWLGGLKVRGHWVDMGVGGRITFSRTLDLREIGIVWANCIQLAQDRAQLSGTMKKAGSFLTN